MRMRFPRTCSTRSFSAAVTASVFALTTLAPHVARADGETTVDPTPKGIVGGALLGAEVGTIIESIAGVHSPWIYIVTDIVLAGGGAVGGWEVEQTSSDGRAPVFMLAGGIGLIIPAVVLTLNATRYRPSENASEDHAPTNSPAANPGTPGGSVIAPTSSPPPPPPASAPPGPSGNPAPGTSGTSGEHPAREVHASLVDVTNTGLHLGVPVPEIRPVFSASELRQYGFSQQTEVRMPIVKVTF
jgi:hypothetical protein